VRGDVAVVQDADLEYNPRDIPALLMPIERGEADVVFGSRFLGGPHRVLNFWHYVGNRALTLLSNMCTNLNLTDMETGYKLFRREVLQQIQIECDRFGFEPEITAKVAQMRCRIFEQPISYNGATTTRGKKITWRDGVAALYHIARFSIRDRRVRPAPPSASRRSWPVPPKLPTFAVSTSNADAPDFRRFRRRTLNPEGSPTYEETRKIDARGALCARPRPHQARPLVRRGVRALPGEPHDLPTKSGTPFSTAAARTRGARRVRRPRIFATTSATATGLDDTIVTSLASIGRHPRTRGVDRAAGSRR
jgi:hypothetical protein